MGFTIPTGLLVRDEILNVSTNPQSFGAGTWPVALMNGYIWGFTIVPSAANGATYSGFRCLFAQSHGGIWIVNNTLNLYDLTDTLQFSQGLTWPAAARIFILLNVLTSRISISGATTGNGNFAIGTGPWFSAALDGGVLQSGQVSGSFSFSGVVGSIYNWGQAQP